MRRALALLVTFLALFALSGGDCGNSTDPGATDEPVCEEPVYDPPARTVQGFVGEYFYHDLQPDFEDPDARPATIDVQGTLPPGIEFDVVAAEDFVDGTPTTPGTWTVTVEATVDCETEVHSDTLELTIEVLDACPVISGAPELAFSTELGGSLSGAIDYVGGFGELSYAVTGALPPGVEFDGETVIDAFLGFEGTPSESGSWQLVLTVSDECPEQQDVVVPVTITVTEPSDGIAPGVYDCALTGGENCYVEQQVSFGSVSPPYLCGAGTNGWLIMSLVNPLFATLASANFGANWGALPLAGGWDGSDHETKGMFFYGPGGALLRIHDGDWGFSQGWTSEAVSDACRLDDAAGPEHSDRLVFCEPGTGRVVSIRYDTDLDVFSTHGSPIYASTFGNAVPRSVCPTASATTGTFILCDATRAEDGKLWYGDASDPFADCTEIGTIGPQPVSVRAANNIFVCADFTANTVTCGLVNGGADATIEFSTSTGDGPFRCDLIDMGNGDTAIAVACFDDASVNLIVVNSFCELQSNTSLSLPAELGAPGGCSFLHDGSVDLVVNGHADGKVGVVDTGLGN